MYYLLWNKKRSCYLIESFSIKHVVKHSVMLSDRPHIYRRCGKVMFSQACVKNFLGGRCTPPGQTSSLGRHALPRGDTPLRGSHCNGRYASYWNAFFLKNEGAHRQNIIALIATVVEFQQVGGGGGLYPSQKV